MSKADNKVLVIVFSIVGVVLLPSGIFAQGTYSGTQSYPPPTSNDPMNPGTPPVEQTLVPEGAFAVQLAQALNLGQIQDEAQAEDLLSSVGIEPKNGWIGNYPVTPDIVAEIEDSVAAAVDSNKLSMDKDEAQRTVQAVLASLGLNIEVGSPGVQTGQQVNPAPEVVDNYYDQYGPPVVTYYPPPPDYTYLYAWVPYPFACGGFFFGGFFVLHDFHRHVHFHDHVFVVSNHFVEPKSHRVFVIDPKRRHFESHAFGGFHSKRDFDDHVLRPFDSRSEFRSQEVQRSAGSIMAHNRAFSDHSLAPNNPPSMPQGSFGRGFHEGGELQQGGEFHHGGEVHQGTGFPGGFHVGGGGGFHGGGGGHR